MCRLFALTASDLRPTVRLDIIDRAMVLHYGENQRDGWGITDGIRVWKNYGSYGSNFDWTNEISHHRIVVGHVRNASARMGKSNQEAHPFIFPRFIAAHNGNFGGICLPTNGEPRSDSYVGFKRLSAKRTEITGDNLSEWLSEFNDLTQFAIMILHRNKLYLARDNKCQLHFCHIGNGLLIMTSLFALDSMRKYIRARHGVEIGTITNVPMNYLYHLELGNRRYKQQRLIYTYQPTSLYAPGVADEVLGWMD